MFPLQEHEDYELIQSTNPELNKAIVRVNIFHEHRQTIQVSVTLVTILHRAHDNHQSYHDASISVYNQFNLEGQIVCKFAIEESLTICNNGTNKMADQLYILSYSKL